MSRIFRLLASVGSRQLCGAMLVVPCNCAPRAPVLLAALVPTAPCSVPFPSRLVAAAAAGAARGGAASASGRYATQNVRIGPERPARPRPAPRVDEEGSFVGYPDRRRGAEEAPPPPSSRASRPHPPQPEQRAADGWSPRRPVEARRAQQQQQEELQQQAAGGSRTRQPRADGAAADPLPPRHRPAPARADGAAPQGPSSSSSSPRRSTPPLGGNRTREAAATAGAARAPAAAAAAGAAVAAAATSAATLVVQPPPPAEQGPDGRVVLPDGVYPTYVPRNAGIRDGTWNDADAAMVRAAQRDAPAPAPAGPSRVEQQEGLVLLGRELPELEELAARHGQPRFRAKQLMDAVLQGASNVMDIATIPKEWRQQLSGSGVRSGRSLLHHSVGDADGTRKFLLQLQDGRIVETVGIPAKGRLTVCVSSQVGCPMRCTFCATGKGGFARNLLPHEIVDQVLTVQEQYGKRVSNVVFMGMGEPLLNLASVTKAYHVLNKQLGIGGAFITISTVGVPNAITRLASAQLKATLAVSIHAPTQQLRESIIPSAKAYPLEALMEECAAYFKATGRRVTFEYTLLSGVNDHTEHAAALAALLRKYNLMSHVNVIPWNPVDESEFVRPSRNRVFAFKRVIEEQGLACTIRETRGLEAAAACGQLRNQHQKVPLQEFDKPT